MRERSLASALTVTDLREAFRVALRTLRHAPRAMGRRRRGRDPLRRAADSHARRSRDDPQREPQGPRHRPSRPEPGRSGVRHDDRRRHRRAGPGGRALRRRHAGPGERHDDRLPGGRRQPSRPLSGRRHGGPLRARPRRPRRDQGRGDALRAATGEHRCLPEPGRRGPRPGRPGHDARRQHHLGDGRRQGRRLRVPGRLADRRRQRPSAVRVAGLPDERGHARQGRDDLHLAGPRHGRHRDRLARLGLHRRWSGAADPHGGGLGLPAVAPSAGAGHRRLGHPRRQSRLPPELLLRAGRRHLPARRAVERDRALHAG